MKNLTFYFKSGNQVTIDNVVSYKLIDGNKPSLTLAVEKPKRKLVPGSLDFDEIDCIIEH